MDKPSNKPVPSPVHAAAQRGAQEHDPQQQYSLIEENAAERATPSPAVSPERPTDGYDSIRRVLQEREAVPQSGQERQWHRPVLVIFLIILICGLAWRVGYFAGSSLDLRQELKRTWQALNPQPDSTPASANSSEPTSKPARRNAAPSVPSKTTRPALQETPPAERPVLQVLVEGEPNPGGRALNRSIAEFSGSSANHPWIIPSPVSPMRIRISPRESLAMLLRRVSPAYPPEARARGVQGTVVLAAVIGKDGFVHQLKVFSGNELLAPAALAAVQRWQYRPYYVEGQPQEVETLVVVEFSLAEGPHR